MPRAIFCFVLEGVVLETSVTRRTVWAAQIRRQGAGGVGKGPRGGGAPRFPHKTVDMAAHRAPYRRRLLSRRPMAMRLGRQGVRRVRQRPGWAGQGPIQRER